MIAGILRVIAITLVIGLIALVMMYGGTMLMKALMFGAVMAALMAIITFILYICL